MWDKITLFSKCPKATIKTSSGHNYALRKYYYIATHIRKRLGWMDKSIKYWIMT